MTDRQAEKLIKLAKELSAIIYKYERILKPSEADKARQVNKILKQMVINIYTSLLSTSLTRTTSKKALNTTS